jgi:Peptidase family S41
VAHDGHLYLTNDPAQYAAMLAPPASSDGVGALHHEAAVRDHSGLTKLEILPGDIRYLRLEHFQWIPDSTSVAYDDAARFLRDGDAVIIDLRGNGGGSSDAADYFAKSFLPPDPDPTRGASRFARPRPTLGASVTRRHPQVQLAIAAINANYPDCFSGKTMSPRRSGCRRASSA